MTWQMDREGWQGARAAAHRPLSKKMHGPVGADWPGRAEMLAKAHRAVAKAQSDRLEQRIASEKRVAADRLPEEHRSLNQPEMQQFYGAYASLKDAHDKKRVRPGFHSHTQMAVERPKPK